MNENEHKLTMPNLPRSTATCEVCGRSFTYYGKRRPHTCHDGECRHAWHYRINPETWAGHQYDIFK